MNVVLGEFRGSSYNTNFIKYKFFEYIYDLSLVNSSRNFLAPAVKFMICKAQTPSVCQYEICKDFIRFR